MKELEPAVARGESAPDWRRYMAILELDDAEVRRRRALFELSDDDLARLASLRPFAERRKVAIVDALYVLLLAHPEGRPFFPDDATVARVKRTQSEYFMGLFAGRCDLAYVEDRLRVGVAHERIGVTPKLYLGAYRRYLDLILEHLAQDFANEGEARSVFRCVQKIVYFDVSIAMDTYVAANIHTMQRQQAAIRELSTPVIRVHDRILLLPLVGPIDSARADQLVETAAERVCATHARAMIIDIAGVPDVDTHVAAHLLNTSAALRLVGAISVLSGISAQVARTFVELGVNISGMHTVGRLSDGIELALGLTGEQIVPRANGDERRP